MRKTIDENIKAAIREAHQKMLAAGEVVYLGGGLFRGATQDERAKHRAALKARRQTNT